MGYLRRDSGQASEDIQEMFEALEACKEVFNFLRSNSHSGNIKIHTSKVHGEALHALFKDSNKKVNRIINKIERRAFKIMPTKEG
jgi:transcriptional regulator of NAD metabolism